MAFGKFIYKLYRVYFFITLIMGGLFFVTYICIKRRLQKQTKDSVTIKVVSAIDQYYKMQNESKGS